MLAKLPEGTTKTGRVSGGLANEDVRALVEHGIISRVGENELVDRPTMQEIIPFSVVERTDDGEFQRRRFIAWTRVDNMSLKEYEPYVPLSHPAYYLHNVSSSFAVKRDLACSFFQIGLPLESRAKFRFSHEGEMYEMTVMPMGHRCAPEIMHTVTATIAGHSHYCKQSHGFTSSAIDVYIDGVRFAGSFNAVQHYENFIDQRAKSISAKFKSAEGYPLTKYVYNGVLYDHQAHKVALGPKVLSKIEANHFGILTYSDLEACVGRFIYSSGILGMNLPRFHNILRITRRRINELNRYPLLADVAVPLSKVTRCGLAKWRDELRANIPVAPQPRPDTVVHQHVLYTDASKVGWGGVLYTDYGEMICVGGKWDASFDYEVNRAEIRAVYLSIEKLKHHFREGTCLDLYVDNVSCMAAVNRKISKSSGVSDELEKVLNVIKKQGIAVDARYVSTKSNPADKISRLRYAEADPDNAKGVES